VHANGDVRGRRARFGGVLQQVDQHLLELTLIETRELLRQRAIEAKRQCPLETRQEALPGNAGAPRLRQLGETGVAVDEAREVRCAAGNGGEHPLELRLIGLLREQLARMCERCDRGK